MGIHTSRGLGPLTEPLKRLQQLLGKVACRIAHRETLLIKSPSSRQVFSGFRQASSQRISRGVSFIRINDYGGVPPSLLVIRGLFGRAGKVRHRKGHSDGKGAWLEGQSLLQKRLTRSEVPKGVLTRSQAH